MENFTEVKYTKFMSNEIDENPQVDVERLKELMKEKKWRVSDLAYYSGVNYNTVYAMVRGRRTNPQSANLNAIATALSVTPDYLLRKSDHRKPPKEKLPEQVRQLASIAGRLSVARQEELVRIAEILEDLERKQPLYTLTEEAYDSLAAILDSLENTAESQETALLLRDVLTGINPRSLAFGNGEPRGKPHPDSLQH